MIFDMMIVPEQNPQNAVEIAQFLDANGFGGAWIGDSPPLGWGDVYATLALCGAATSRIALRTGVTNPLNRHAIVSANAIITIQKISGGRAALGIGTGDSALRALGLKPAKISTLIEYIEEIRRVCAERSTPVPIYMAASGPKALEAAGRIADGVLISVGTHPSLVRQALERVDQGAREAGRSMDGIDVTFHAGLSISDHWAEAKRNAAPLAARRAMDALFHPEFCFPADLNHLRSDAERVAKQYDYRKHLNADAGHDDLITDGLIEIYTVTGNSEACAARLKAMRDVGAKHVSLFPSGHDRFGTIRKFAKTIAPAFW